MNIFKRIFSGEDRAKKQNDGSDLKKAIAFVDYEHWYVSMKRNFGLAPDIGKWFEDLKQRVQLTEAVFFADFSKKSLADEISRIRTYTNKIIDTRNPTGNSKKDFTDFIILDNMYQRAFASDAVDVFILFSGDGHFSSVTSFLKNFRQKEVGIYGVKDSFSRQLQTTASWCVTVPFEDELYGAYYAKILKYLKDAEELKSSNLPTYDKTLSAICSDPKADRQRAKDALEKLIELHIITKHNVALNGRGGKKTMQALFVNWEKAAEEEIV